MGNADVPVFLLMFYIFYNYFSTFTASSVLPNFPRKAHTPTLILEKPFKSHCPKDLFPYH